MSRKGKIYNERINHLDVSEKRWFAIYTKYKAEKYVVEQLQKRKIEAYIPLLKQVKRYSTKVKTTYIPLINSYVFVKIDKSQYKDVLSTMHVFEFVKQRYNLISIPVGEIELLKKIVGERYNLQIAEEGYAAGDQIEVIAGNLTGLKGRLISAKGKQNVLVELENIGFQFFIEVEKSLIVKRG